jgi:hypothetical protein
MDVSNIAALSTAMSQNAAQQQLNIAILKKSMDVQSATAAALISTIPAVSSSLPDNIGMNINTSA